MNFLGSIFGQASNPACAPLLSALTGAQAQLSDPTKVAAANTAIAALMPQLAAMGCGTPDAAAPTSAAASSTLGGYTTYLIVGAVVLALAAGGFFFMRKKHPSPALVAARRRRRKR